MTSTTMRALFTKAASEKWNIAHLDIYLFGVFECDIKNCVTKTINLRFETEPKDSVSNLRLIVLVTQFLEVDNSVLTSDGSFMYIVSFNVTFN